VLVLGLPAGRAEGDAVKPAGPSGYGIFRSGRSRKRYLVPRFPTPDRRMVAKLSTAQRAVYVTSRRLLRRLVREAIGRYPNAPAEDLAADVCRAAWYALTDYGRENEAGNWTRWLSEEAEGDRSFETFARAQVKGALAHGYLDRTELERGDKIARREARRYTAAFPALRYEDLAAVAMERTWTALRDYDAAQNPNLLAYLTQRVQWAILHFVAKELPPALRVFAGALRAAMRHGETLAPAAIPDDPQEAVEMVDALLAEHAAVFVGRLYGDLHTGGGEDGAIDRLDGARLIGAVDGALATLPEDARDVWRRRYEDEQTIGEIAAAMGRSEGTAKRRVADVTAAVRAHLRTLGMGGP
jgi:RNA polymerase sigma factor (sigma-70 family)